MEVKVCIGSACHLKGSYEVIEKLKSLIQADGLGDEIVLKASFCLGHCGEGVTVCKDGEFLTDVTPSTIENIYFKEIKTK